MPMETPNRSRLDAVDFTDVYGGPPRTICGRRKLSVDFPNYNSLYEDIFRIPETVPPEKKTGRSLTEFTIPEKKRHKFYSNIFRNGRSSKVKSNSSLAISSENFSPLRPEKLRPAHVPCKWNSATMAPAIAEHPYDSSSGSENRYAESFAYKNSYQGFSVSSTDVTRLETSFYRRAKVSASDYDLQSSSSGRSSSLCQDWADQGRFQSDNDDGEEVMSHVIETKSDYYREANEDAINEAVAWAKARYQRHNISENDADMQERSKERVKTNHSSMHFGEEDEPDKRSTEAKKLSQDDMTFKLLENNVELWSSGKKSDIRWLLSSLHQILWPDSSWHAIPLTNLTDRSRVKKAYKKVQLCLHPDKLQQRGATPTQKFVSAKVFSILQDAWDVFITQDELLIRGSGNEDI